MALTMNGGVILESGSPKGFSFRDASEMRELPVSHSVGFSLVHRTLKLFSRSAKFTHLKQLLFIIMYSEYYGMHLSLLDLQY